MANQKLVAVHAFPFLHVVEQLSYSTKQTCNFLPKVTSLVNFDYFSSQAWFFGFICRHFLKRFIKKRSL